MVLFVYQGIGDIMPENEAHKRPTMDEQKASNPSTPGNIPGEPQAPAPQGTPATTPPPAPAQGNTPATPQGETPKDPSGSNSEKPKKARRTKGRGRTRDRLSKKAKLEIIQDLIKANPDYKRYGFNTAVRKIFLEEYKVKVDPSYISKLIKEALAVWKNAENVRIGKGQYLDTWMALFRRAEDTRDKIRIWTEIGKVEGHYQETLNLKLPGVEEKQQELTRQFRLDKANVKASNPSDN